MLVAALVVVGLTAGDRGSGDRPQRSGTTSAQEPIAQAGTPTSATPVRPDGAEATGTAARDLGSPRSDAASPSDDGGAEDLAAARDVAAAFAAAYATYRFDDPPEAVAQRVGSYVTDDLLADLRRASGALAARRDIAAAREIAEGQVEAVITEDLSGGRVVLLVAVRQVITGTDGERLRRPVYRLTVLAGADGWRVAAVDR